MPIRAVAVSARARLACYPRSTFNPLSHGLSTQYHKIIKPCFRTCSTCLSRSQAPLCLYTLRAVSNRAEGTFGRLRYILGGDRPSQTTRLTMSPTRIHGPGLDTQNNKGGISRATPHSLAATLQSLPPILHMIFRVSLPSCSKGARGLSV